MTQLKKPREKGKEQSPRRVKELKEETDLSVLNQVATICEVL